MDLRDGNFTSEPDWILERVKICQDGWRKQGTRGDGINGINFVTNVAVEISIRGGYFRGKHKRGLWESRALRQTPPAPSQPPNARGRRGWVEWTN
jgi:hypothetical protein